MRCDKADAQAEVSGFQLRSLRCRLKPLEAQVVREEAIIETVECGDACNVFQPHFGRFQRDVLNIFQEKAGCSLRALGFGDLR